MTDRPPCLGVVIAFAAIVLAGCATPGPSAATPPPTGASLPGTSWEVVAIGGTDTLAAPRPTMAFGADGQITGTGGCNGYSGPYMLDGAAIAIGDLASTLILCEGDVGTQEAAFMAALRGAQTWRIMAGGDLELGGFSSILASPAVAGPSESPAGEGLEGRWALSEMGGTADFARLLPTIEFAADGSVSGFAACNTFHGNYTIDGQTLTLGPLSSTKVACERPASAVEAAYLEALAGVTGWAVEPDGRLLLDGPVLLRFTRG